MFINNFIYFSHVLLQREWFNTWPKTEHYDMICAVATYAATATGDPLFWCNGSKTTQGLTFICCTLLDILVIWSSLVPAGQEGSQAYIR